MEVVVLTIHLLVCVCLIGLVLLQRSEGGALGMGGGGGGSLMTGRGAADALAKMTSVAGGFFLVTSLGLTVLAGATSSNRENTIFDFMGGEAQQEAPLFGPTEGAPPAEEAPVDARPDPTESSVPASTQLASAIMPGPANASAETPAGATRAAPIENRSNAQSVPASAQRTTPPPASTTARPNTTAPATTQRANAPATTPATTTPQRSNTATNTNQPRANNTQANARQTTPALTLPNTSGGTGLVATDPNQTQPESIQVGNGLEAVRRERAGPDQ